MGVLFSAISPIGISFSPGKGICTRWEDISVPITLATTGVWASSLSDCVFKMLGEGLCICEDSIRQLVCSFFLYFAM